MKIPGLDDCHHSTHQEQDGDTVKEVRLLLEEDTGKDDCEDWLGGNDHLDHPKGHLLESVEVCNDLQETNYGSEDKEKTILQGLASRKRRMVFGQAHRNNQGENDDTPEEKKNNWIHITNTDDNCVCKAFYTALKNSN